MARVLRSQIEVIDPNTVKLRGYAAIFGNTFKYFDWREWKVRTLRIVQGAFTSVLERLGDEPLDTYWKHHTCCLQLGQTSVLRQDDVGLYYESPVFATREAIDTLTVIDGRGRTGGSFSFEFGEVAPVDGEDGVEELLSFSELYELGPCPVGANPLAYTQIVDLDSEEDEEPASVPEPINEEPEPAESDAELAAATWALVAHLRGSNYR